MDPRDVAAAYWGLGRQGQAYVPPDAAGLGPAPRERRPEWTRYARKRAGVLTALAWLATGCAVLLLVPAIVVSIAAITIQCAVFAALAALLFVLRNRAAGRIEWVLANGQLVGARVVRSTVIPRHRGPDRCDLVLQIAERRVLFTTYDPTVGNMMQPGLDIELVWHAREAEIIVPTFDLPPI